MARVVGKLSPTKLTALLRAGVPKTHSDGGNLYLQISGPGNASWIFRYAVRGSGSEGRKPTTRYPGLGSVTTVGLADARQRAREMRQLLLDGVDPLGRRRETKAIAAAPLTFSEVADLYIGSHEAAWRSQVHSRQWRNSLRDHVLPIIGSAAVSNIGTTEVMSLLETLWNTKPETASRVRQRVEAVLDYARARGWRQGENPARWRGHLANLLPAKEKVAPVQHYPAMPWPDVPPFLSALALRKGTAAKALTLLILTAARSSEVRNATWAEIDLKSATWTIPAGRMKSHREHRVPLPNTAIALLRELVPALPSPNVLVFPGAKADRPLSDVALAKLLPPATTCHGFRSSFRTWAGETTSFPREVVEMALAHRTGDAVEQAYARGDLFARRRALMSDWAAYCAPTPNDAEPETRQLTQSDHSIGGDRLIPDKPGTVPGFPADHPRGHLRRC